MKFIPYGALKDGVPYLYLTKREFLITQNYWSVSGLLILSTSVGYPLTTIHFPFTRYMRLVYPKTDLWCDKILPLDGEDIEKYGGTWSLRYIV